MMTVEPRWMSETWVGKDIEVELRNLAAIQVGEQVLCQRTPLPDGTDLVTLDVGAGGGGRRFERETGHLKIAEIVGGRRL